MGLIIDPQTLYSHCTIGFISAIGGHISIQATCIVESNMQDAIEVGNIFKIFKFHSNTFKVR